MFTIFSRLFQSVRAPSRDFPSQVVHICHPVVPGKVSDHGPRLLDAQIHRSEGSPEPLRLDMPGKCDVSQPTGKKNRASEQCHPTCCKVAYRDNLIYILQTIVRDEGGGVEAGMNRMEAHRFVTRDSCPTVERTSGMLFGHVTTSAILPSSVKTVLPRRSPEFPLRFWTFLVDSLNCFPNLFSQSNGQ